ncbi:ATP-binding cassette domain-containing protein [Pseudohongiella sp. SYSU M77423]|uniref:ATP-binding cassette domain-containing protein n=1 Tax=Pseudohongiella sp. SYSU M77423 TaxID=3042312 RepID=UPI0024817253|nr:ATP-binding cassette domain-containing protein [Pseudohongiella sp. SYSU M77423]MDH7942859.1 ATP-binding cassette domain-containing protein [Pseudohongiella sp. SYSU M77423]
MLLFRLNNLSLAFGDHPLLDQVSLTIHKGERIGILGPNGAGKSTFMKVLLGRIQADGGELWRAEGIKVAYLDQQLPERDEQTLYDYIAGGLEGLGDLLRQYHQLTRDSNTDFSDQQVLDRMASLQKQIEQVDGWAVEHRIEAMLDVLKLPADAKMKTLSGGSRRRAALGRALIAEPDLLMLDEPTNHLDIPTIEWLENTLNEFRGAVLVITHDRQFLQSISNRIIELDRGRLRSWEYGYERFLVFREQQLEAEEKANQEFDKKLAEEERWIRQGIKARRTRNEGRVRALKQLREERKQRRELSGPARMSLEQAGSSGKIVVEAEDLNHRFGDQLILKNFSTKILRGDRVGLIGANGSGKTTLLRILLGEIVPDSGKVKLGTNLEILYFDQLRNQLDLEQNIIDYLAEGREFIDINGKQKHVISYLQDFLFPPKRVRQPIKSLSGGEQNRLILAKLFSKPANLVVLDEPTNDLDMETLELLEEILLDFSGTLLVVSHDRKFLDNVVTSSIVFEGPGIVKEYVGGYQDWLDQGGKMLSFLTDERKQKDTKTPTSNTASIQKTEQRTEQKTNQKIDRQKQKALDQVTRQIEKTEQEIKAVEDSMAEPGFYDQPQTKIQPTLDKMAALQEKLDQLFEQWQALEDE